MMNALGKGFKQVLIHKNIVVYLFLIQLLFAGIVGSVIQKDLQTNLGQTIAGQVFEADFNYSVFTDMMRSIPDAFANSGKVFVIVFVINFILAIFLHAGSIQTLLQSQKQSFKTFISSAAKLFFPFIFFAIFFLILFVLISAVIFGPLAANSLPFVEWLESDRLFFYVLYVCLFVYFLLLSFITNWSINARIHCAKSKESWWQSLKAGGAQTRRNYLSLTGYFLLFTLLAFLGIWINIKLDNLDALVLTFILSLVILIGKIIIRLWNYSTLAVCSDAIIETV